MMIRLMTTKLTTVYIDPYAVDALVQVGEWRTKVLLTGGRTLMLQEVASFVAQLIEDAILKQDKEDT